MSHAFLALGSNLANPKQQLKLAIDYIMQLPTTKLLAQSRFYQSKPLQQMQQPDYYNAVVKIATELSAEELLQQCQKIEKEQGRIHIAERWQARIIDIDILLYSDHIIQQRHLIIPHPEMLKRDFVLVPLCEIEPELVLPSGEKIKNYLHGLTKHLV